MKWMKNYFLMQGLYPVGIAGLDSAGRVVQAPFGENRTYDPSYYIMKMELAKGKRKRDGPVRVLYRPPYSSYSNPILYEKGFGYIFCLQEVLRRHYSEQ